jgi:hypothetical protein
MTQMLLDEIQPDWHVRSRHSRVIDASVDRVAEALESMRLDRDASPLMRFFFRARGLALPSGPTPRDALTATGFTVLAEREGREIVFGIAGKFWAPREMAHLVRVPDARAYKEFDRPGEAKGAMTLVVEALPDGRALLKTETRVTCSDLRARLLFGAYWTLIRIPSGLIRNDMLRAIARRAEELERATGIGAGL